MRMMPYERAKHHRRSIRLRGYDYGLAAAYFVTICVQRGECRLGEVVDGEMRLNEQGQIARDFWPEVTGRFSAVSVDAFVIMPNHLHALLVVHAPLQGASETGEEASSMPDALGPNVAGSGTVGAAVVSPRISRPTLGQIVAYYKHQTTKSINRLWNTPGARFWQRNYWEHIVRDERSLNRIREYIEHNPARWTEDQLHPDAAPNPFNRWR